MELLKNATDKFKEATLSAIEAINNGAEFNGKVYRKNNGKKWALMFIYLDGEIHNFGSVYQADFNEEAKLFLACLEESQKVETKDTETNEATPEVKTEASETKTEWLVNGKTVKNNLGYADMYARYGMDFE